MKKYRVKVIDGPLPPGIWQSINMEPELATSPEHIEVLHELMAREPIFHRPEFGTTRKDFDKLMAPEFWEVTASGRRVSRQFVLDFSRRDMREPPKMFGKLKISAVRRSLPTTF
jgi:hypothetical protein